MAKSLEDFKNELSTLIHGMTKAEAINKGICIDCKEPPVFYTEAGEREYYITGICEKCWTKMFEDKDELTSE